MNSVELRLGLNVLQATEGLIYCGATLMSDPYLAWCSSGMNNTTTRHVHLLTRYSKSRALCLHAHIRTNFLIRLKQTTNGGSWSRRDKLLLPYMYVKCCFLWGFLCAYTHVAITFEFLLSKQMCTSILGMNPNCSYATESSVVEVSFDSNP